MLILKPIEWLVTYFCKLSFNTGITVRDALHAYLQLDQQKVLNNKMAYAEPDSTVPDLNEPELQIQDVPDVVIDHGKNKSYKKGKFLGRGGYARCYELTDVETKQTFAGKVVSKAHLVKESQKDKLVEEISIHRSLKHEHVVEFHSFFEDDDNVYILLELCPRRSLTQMRERRGPITEPETRYLIQQIALATDYLHKNRVVHRDLKLANLFLNDDMQIKVGDFGLSTRIDFLGERKRTLCGTPNYIAPEVIAKKGHSFEVDSWSLGCIMFTLLVGKPPFETTSLKDTYQRIQDNAYFIPVTCNISQPARALIAKLLHPDPAKRPSMEQVLADDFLHGFTPSSLPTSCLATRPRFSLEDVMRFSRQEKARQEAIAGQLLKEKLRPSNKADDATNEPQKSENEEPADGYLYLMANLLNETMIDKQPIETDGIMNDDAENPESIPIYWVRKWVDFTSSYGIGYQLSDNSYGVLFNDYSRLLLLANGQNVQYIENDGTEEFHTVKVFPEKLKQKISMLKKFRKYMKYNLLTAGAHIAPRETDQMVRLPFLRTWFRTRTAMILHLSNGVLQINFFHDHTKIIICPLLQAVTLIDEHGNFRTFKLELIAKHGCSIDLANRLNFARPAVERLIESIPICPRVVGTREIEQ